jgi:hypothetical protein
MSIRKIIDWAIDDKKNTMQAKIVGEPTKKYDNTGSWVWAVDVDLGLEVNSSIRSVPIATNNWDILFSQQGKGVTISRMGSAQWSVTGLAKVVSDTLHITELSFDDDIWEITSSRMIGDVIRPLTYGELGTILTDAIGYGILPYGIQAKFDYDGNLIQIMEY